MGVLILAGFLFATASPSRAGVPDPSSSLISHAFIVCPAGDLAPSFLIRDFAHNPIAGASVVADFDGCSNHRYCSDPFPDPTITFVGPGWIAGITTAGGTLSMPVRMTGGCPGTPTGYVRIYADGVLLAPTAGTLMSLASTDQNGDFAVDAADEALLAAKIAGGVDRTADLDGNGVVDGLDLDVLHAHLNHVCVASTPTRRSRWGELKLLYR